MWQKPEVAIKHDELTGALVGLARAAQGKSPGRKADELMMQGLFATITNVNFDGDRIDEFKRLVQEEKAELGGAEDFSPADLWQGNTDTVSLRSTLLFGLRGMAAYAWHAYVLGKTEDEVTSWFYKGMRAIGEEHSIEEWLDLLMESGRLTSSAWPARRGQHLCLWPSVPVKVSNTIAKGPFIVVTGHDYDDLEQLLSKPGARASISTPTAKCCPPMVIRGLRSMNI